MNRTCIIRALPDPSAPRDREAHQVEELEYVPAEGKFRAPPRPVAPPITAYLPGGSVLPVGTVVRARPPLPSEEGLGDLVIVGGVADAIVHPVITS